MKRIICIAVLAFIALVVTLSGCTTSDKIGREDPSFVRETLSSVVLLSGEEIVFSKEGGKYQLLGAIVGTGASGTPMTILLDNVYEARTWHAPPVPFDSSSSWTTAEVLLKDSSLITFEPPGARFEKAKNLIMGRNKRDSQPIGFHPDRVLEYRAAAGKSINVHFLKGDTATRFAEVVLEHPFAQTVEFDPNGGRVGASSEWIVGRTMAGTTHVPLDSILYATVTRADVAKTIIAVVGGTVAVAALVVGIVLLTKQSCPFLYSYDGAQYRFDAEPLGGATTEGLARTDYSRLKYLRPIDGTYRMLMRNEVDETQFVDAISLCIVDHDPSRIVIAAGANNFHLLPPPDPAVSATDEHGRNLLPFLSKQDGIAWQTHLDGLPAKIENVRQTLTLRFLKPRSAQRAQLVVHGGTTPWGSNVIRLMYNLPGTDVNRWYGEADRKGAELFKLLKYLDDEELYTLRVYLQKNGVWAQRGMITGGGPFVHETQTIPLNVAGIDGDTLAIQVHPPLGFWSFDFAGIVYDDDSVCTATELPLLSATDQAGGDISGLLGTEDHQYFELPTNSYQATLTFAVPPERPGLMRSIFAKTSGFYRLHLPMDHPPQTAMMERLNSTPGEIVRYSIEKYREWLQPLRAQLKTEDQQ